MECTHAVRQLPQAPIFIKGTSIKFLVHTKPFREKNALDAGARKVERRGKWLHVTGLERTLIEGFRNPDYAGGLEELVVSAGGFPVLDLNLLFEILEIYAARKLFAGVGWVLERYQNTFHVPDQYLAELENQCPRSPQYVLRNQREGTLFSRWNLILPDEIIHIRGLNDT